MTYSVTFTTTKPENAAWFNDVNPAAVLAINEWLPTNAGFVSSTKELKTSTTLVKTITFDNEANYNAYVQAKQTNANVQARRDYNRSNGITTTAQVI